MKTPSKSHKKPKKKIIVEPINANPPPPSTNPTVSVIIPMYNAEQYVSECLDSLLAQTFQDFEVIIADDCSTDSSVAIVESYMPKFDGRLRLTHTETNSGGCAVPRNVGFPLARGEYIYFVDSDDALTKTGLEEVYTLAKEYDADVVYCERYYMSEGVGEDFIKNMQVAESKVQPAPYVEKPTLESYDLAERIQGLLNSRFWPTAWLKVVRRDLLDKHKINFAPVRPGEDDIWTCSLIFFAKNFLRVPNIIYVRRMREGSIMSTTRTPQQLLSFWLNPVLLGLKDLDNLMSQMEFLQENPQQYYAVLEKQSRGKLFNGFKSAEVLNSDDVYETIKNDFAKDFGEYITLISALCTYLFKEQKSSQELKQKIKRIEDDARQSKNLLAEKDKEIRRLKDMSYNLERQFICPAISVVIPMYEAEKYIGELLDSLLAQTFKDFEVIVVDDCSTDNSVAVVESYAPKFDGRLILQKLETNSGTGGSVPRNAGFKFARGKYVYFVDADDYLAKSALETFYTAAEKFEADVVYTSSYRLLHHPNESRLEKDGYSKKFSEAENANLIIDEPDKNLHILLFERGFTNPWVHFSRKDFLLKNKILFPEIPNGVDYLWVLQVYCYAKRLLRIPDALYFYRRYHPDSISTRQREPREQVSYWISTFASWLKVLSDLSNKIDILKSNSPYVLAAAERHFNWCLNRTDEARKTLTDRDIYEILCSEFAKVNVSSELTVPFLFSVIDLQQKELQNKQKAFYKFKEYYTARIDIRLTTEAAGSDFNLFAVSDKKAKVSKPTWLQKDGIGYMLTSLEGNLDFTAKATMDGQIQLSLRGEDVRDPKDKSKRIPCWIDYTKLIVSGETVFNKPVPVWHDKPYRCSFEAKAEEEIKIQLEWLPHRSDIIEPEIKTPPPPKVTIFEPEIKTPPPPKVTIFEPEIKTPPPPKVTIFEPEIKTPPPPKVTAPEPKVVNLQPPKIERSIPRKFNPLTTARIDVKFVSTTGDFQILSISDNKASVSKPSWFQHNGIGYIVQSSNGKLTFIAQATADGQINLNLRGMDVRNPEDWAKGIAKRIPYWIDYTNLTVNEKNIFSTRTPAWCDEPYLYNLEVKAGEEIKIQVEWQPQRNDT